MNTRVSFSILSALLVISIGLSSCAKKEKPDTLFTRLIGTWKQVKQATDDNNNGTIDDWEITPLDPNLTNTMEFGKDSTGIDKKTYSLDLKFQWHILGESSIQLNYEANDTVIYRVVNASSNQLTLTTRLPQGLVGLYFERQ